jgi:hypothetical protein
MVNFEKKLVEAQENRRALFINSAIAIVVISVIAIGVMFFLSNSQNKSDEKTAILSDDADTLIQAEPITVAEPIPSTNIPDEELRQAYIGAVNDYQNRLLPKLNNVDLAKWNKTHAERLIQLEGEALSKFSSAEYKTALQLIEETKTLAQTLIDDSQQQYEKALSQAQQAYDEDRYQDAKFQIDTALMLNKESIDATRLSDKIAKLPELLPLLEKSNTARVENKHQQELNSLNKIIKLAPDRVSAIERKQVLVEQISNNNFKSAIKQTHQAITQGDVELAKQKIAIAMRIFPHRQEIKEATTALKQLEQQQRLESYLQSAQSAIAADNWSAVQKPLELALSEQADNQIIQNLLIKATSIIALNNEFDQHINNPYRLSNSQRVSKVKARIGEASAFSNDSPSLNKKAAEVTVLIEKMNQKIPVEITSDNQTDILVRGVGMVGIIESKIIQLLPGQYKFEGKRKGYKSKLIDVLIPYDQSSYQLTIYCDEAI